MTAVNDMHAGSWLQISAETAISSQSSTQASASLSDASLVESDISSLLTDTTDASGRRLLAKQSTAGRSAAEASSVDTAKVAGKTHDKALHCCSGV